MDKTLFYLKKTFNLIRSLVIKSGSILIFGINSFYYKDTGFNCYSLNVIDKSIFDLVVKTGIFSNHLYNKDNLTIPNIFLIFDYDSYKSVIKEIQALGVLIIGIVKNTDSFLGEYPIVSNNLTYFSHYFMLNIYSKIILFNRV
jgi:ribosomal protein S2